MKTKIVYTLVSNELDYYYEQLLISVYSLRLHNPNSIVELVCDEDTYLTLKGKRQNVKKYLDTIHPIKVPCKYSNLRKSRFLKTRLRDIIQGDYLFIDTDTIIKGDLSGIDNCEYNIGAVFDSHVSTPINPRGTTESEKWISYAANQIGESIVGLYHYNSGVFYVKDNTSNHQFYRDWHTKYDELADKGSFIDQLPLCIVNAQWGNYIQEIPPIWNTQTIVTTGIKLLNEAIVIHYFAKKKLFEIALPELLVKIKITDDIPSEIKNIVSNPSESFSQRYRVAKGMEVEFLNSTLYGTYCTSPHFFSVLEHAAKIYNGLKLSLWNVKQKVKS